jgi:multiple sugar transport system substrate-binding protein
MLRPLVPAAFVVLIVILLSLLFMIADDDIVAGSLAEEEGNVTLTILFNEIGTQPFVWKAFVDKALEVLGDQTNTSIEARYIEYPYNLTRKETIKLITNQTPIDIITLDQIWLSEFVQKGLLTDLTNYAEKQWDRRGDNDWYFENWEGGKHQGRIYGIWAWTDVRGIWYWKDLLKEADVEPDSLKTWDGYIAAAKQLNSVLRPKGIEGVHLTGANHSADLWYPYLWMLGGEILQQKGGHPSRGTYWFPTFNSTAGTKALSFIQDQVEAGVKPQKTHQWGKEFREREFAVMIEGSWMPSDLHTQAQSLDFENKIGFLPMFPVPYAGNNTSTLMGGWQFGIPTTSTHKDLAWKLITEMVDPGLLAPWLEELGFLPTQIAIGEGALRTKTSSSFPYYDEMISVIPLGGIRPSIPEYPQVAQYIKEALDEVYYGTKDPDQALDDAAAKAANALGWR